MECVIFALAVISVMCVCMGILYPIWAIIFEKLIKKSKKTIKEILEDY